RRSADSFGLLINSDHSTAIQQNPGTSSRFVGGAPVRPEKGLTRPELGSTLAPMATKTKTLPARLRQLMAVMDWTQADLVKHSGASRQAVSNWIADGHRTIDPRFAFNLQRATGFSAEWILLGTGPVQV